MSQDFRVLPVGMMIIFPYKTEVKTLDSCWKKLRCLRRVCSERSGLLVAGWHDEECLHRSVLVGLKCVLISTTDLFLSCLYKQCPKRMFHFQILFRVRQPPCESTRQKPRETFAHGRGCNIPDVSQIDHFDCLEGIQTLRTRVTQYFSGI